MSLHLDDLDPSTRKHLARQGILSARTRNVTFTAEMKRRHAIRVLDVIHDLSQSQRRRVLEHALEVNKV